MIYINNINAFGYFFKKKQLNRPLSISYTVIIICLIRIIYRDFHSNAILQQGNTRVVDDNGTLASEVIKSWLKTLVCRCNTNTEFFLMTINCTRGGKCHQSGVCRRCFAKRNLLAWLNSRVSGSGTDRCSMARGSIWIYICHDLYEKRHSRKQDKLSVNTKLILR